MLMANDSHLSLFSVASLRGGGGGGGGGSHLTLFLSKT